MTKPGAVPGDRPGRRADSATSACARSHVDAGRGTGGAGRPRAGPGAAEPRPRRLGWWWWWGALAVAVSLVLTLPVAAPVVIGAVLFAVAGAGAGMVARVVLARMRRGAHVRAPVCEVAVAVAWAATGAGRLSGALPGVWLPVLLGLGWLLVACSVVDVLHRRLPDALTVPALPAALLLVLPLGPGAFGRAALGAVVALAVHTGVHLVAPRALGGGDVKLSGSLGAVLAASSWPALVLAVGLAAFASGVVAVALLIGGRTGRTGAVPHGPSMLLATWLVAAGAALGAGAG